MFTNCFSSLVLYLFVCVFPGYIESGCCPDGWIFFQNSCYIFEDELMVDWTEATHFCSSHYQSHVVTIESKEEDLMLRDHANKLFRQGASIGNWFWIGATDDEIEGLWRWYTNHRSLSSGYTNWSPGEPNGNGVSNQDCACLWGDTKFLWNDHYCETKSHVICEKDSTEAEPVVVG